MTTFRSVQPPVPERKDLPAYGRDIEETTDQREPEVPHVLCGPAIENATHVEGEERLVRFGIRGHLVVPQQLLAHMHRREL